METLFTTASAALAAATSTTTPTAAAHDGIAPAAAMPTPFDFPCGVNFLSSEFHKNQQLRDRCGPPNFDEYWWSTVGYYSPAICPRGYTAGCFRWNSDQGPPVEPTETAVQCVPRGYRCKADDISVAFSGAATAPMIQIRWASTDLSTFATHPLYPGANPTNTEEDYLMQRTRGAKLKGRAQSSGYYTSTYPYDSGGGDPPSSSTSRPGSGSSSSNHDRGGAGGGGLSTGAKVGIGVGVSLSAILGFTVLGLIIWYVRRSSKRAQQSQTQQPYMVPSQYAGQTGQGTQMGEAAMTGGAVHMGGPSPEHHSAGQQSRPPQPIYQQPIQYQQHQQYPSASEMDTTPSVANSHWAASTVTPPPAAAVAAERGTNSVAAGSDGRAECGIGGPMAPPSELEGGRTPNAPAEMDSGSPVVPHTQPTVAAEQPRSPSIDPRSVVGAPPGEPSAQELSSLREQHEQLEQRRQRILELERIEQEQEVLRDRMKQAQSGTK
ncbi:hypothetical protein V2A60_009601 [Cordyceps javanica]